MKIVPMVFLVLAQASFAQSPAPTPRPLSGSALDQRPPSTRMARTPVPKPSAVSQLPKGVSSLSFDARNVSNGGGATLNRTNPGAVAGPGKTQTRNSQIVLELKVRNLSAQPASAQFEWYFIGDAVGRGGHYVWDKGSRDVSVAPGAEQKEVLESQPLVETTTRVAKSASVTENGRTGTRYWTETTKSGARPEGWIVRLFAEGKLVRVQASSSELERLGYDTNALAAMQVAPPSANPPPFFPPGFKP